MTNFERVVKSFAICLAVFIITLIASVVIGAFSLVSYIFTDDEPEIKEVHKNYADYDNFENIEVDLASTYLSIKGGDEFKIDGSINEYVEISLERGTLKIKERDKSFWALNEYSTLELSIPDDLLEELFIEIDEGTIDIKNIKVSSFALDLGTGVLNVENSYFENTDIDGGAGEIQIDRTYLGLMNLNAGVGDITLSDIDINDSKIDAGVGALDMYLTGSKDDYTIDVETGLGSITIDEIEVYDGINGNGPICLEIDGGVGSIEIEFKKESHV